ncbi:protein YgfX [Denitrificimonas halotolerans]|uniref:protein YgfX n=1 Tax=Denitrificimonas halotolerans TaxID=3098930 RepID=UPI0038991312
MLNRNKQDLHCFWQPSLRLSWAVLLISSLGYFAVFIANSHWGVKFGIVLLLSMHVLRHLLILLHYSTPKLRLGLRYSTETGWQLWCAQQGWRCIQLRSDSIAVPTLILLRYRFAGQRLYRAVVLPADCLPQDDHRRLRVRLRFSRQRWRAAMVTK